MKLDKKLKDKIDKYFKNIDSNKLYRISIKKYKFKEK